MKEIKLPNFEEYCALLENIYDERLKKDGVYMGANVVSYELLKKLVSGKVDFNNITFKPIKYL